MRLVILVLFSLLASAQQPVLLWPNGAPGAVGTEDADKPSLTVFVPSPNPHPPTPAVVVCPGGGYQHLAMDHEGKQIAEWLNRQGIAAFVLKYRLGPRYRHPAPLDDAKQAMRWVRAHAADYGVDPRRVGIWGFSAGGHLAAKLATHFDDGTRPDFAILAYPVISLGEYAHKGSRDNLLGPNPDPKLVENLSNEKQVTAQTPPTFLFHTTDDNAVPVENSVLFYLALRRAGVPAELHVYEHGRHGVGLAPTDAVLTTWKERLADWLKKR